MTLLILVSLLSLLILSIPILIFLYLYTTHEFLHKAPSRSLRYPHSKHFQASRTPTNTNPPHFHEKRPKREPLLAAASPIDDSPSTSKQSSQNLFSCIIIGAGPVGMTLASTLARNNIQFLLLEKKQAGVHDASKAIGVHPESLEHFEALDAQITKEWIGKAICVQTGRVYAHDQELLGCARLNLARRPFSFSLALEQTKTETVLEDGLLRILQQERDAEVKGGVSYEYASKTSSKVSSNTTPKTTSPHSTHSQYLKQMEVTKVLPIHLATPSTLRSYNFSSHKEALAQNYRYIVHYTCLKTHEEHHALARFVIGCEGKRSIVREAAGIKYEGAPLRDTFIAGDFADNTELGDDAAIFISRNGLVEAFPLPGKRRRFICSTEKYIESPTAVDIIERVKARTGYDLSTQECTWISKFGIQSLVAKRFFNKGLMLAGDSAHVCSPLGGQGMNCGFLDAFELGEVLYKIIHCGGNEEALLRAYEVKQQRRARAAIHRAELNTALGRKAGSSLGYFVKCAFVRVALSEFYPMQWLVAMYFTMRFLGYIAVGKKVIL